MPAGWLMENRLEVYYLDVKLQLRNGLRLLLRTSWDKSTIYYGNAYFKFFFCFRWINRNKILRCRTCDVNLGELWFLLREPVNIYKNGETAVEATNYLPTYVPRTRGFWRLHPKYTRVWLHVFGIFCHSRLSRSCFEKRARATGRSKRDEEFLRIEHLNLLPEIVARILSFWKFVNFSRLFIYLLFIFSTQKAAWKFRCWAPSIFFIFILLPKLTLTRRFTYTRPVYLYLQKTKTILIWIKWRHRFCQGLERDNPCQILVKSPASLDLLSLLIFPPATLWFYERYVFAQSGTTFGWEYTTRKPQISIISTNHQIFKNLFENSRSVISGKKNYNSRFFYTTRDRNKVIFYCFFFSDQRIKSQ